MGLFGKGAGKVLQRFAENAPAIQAYLDGDASEGARLQMAARGQRLIREKAEAEIERGRQLFTSFINLGMSPDQARIAMANPEKAAEEFVTRYRTRELGEGGTVRTPGLDGSASVYTAPKMFQNGADVISTAGSPLSGAPMFGDQPAPPPIGPPGGNTLSGPMSVGGFPAGNPLAGAPRIGEGQGGGAVTGTRVMGLRTDAEQYADSLGLQRGTPQWANAAKDYVLKGNGPTAFGFDQQLQDARLRQSDTNNLRSTSTSRENNIRTTSTSRDNNVRSTETSRAVAEIRGRRGRGGRVSGGNQARAVDPATGRAAILKGGVWVDEKTGRPL